MNKIRLIDLLYEAKKQGYLYFTIDKRGTMCFDEAEMYLKHFFRDDPGFDKSQLAIRKGEKEIIYEIRKSPKHKRCFRITAWHWHEV